jgi:hypothetical protein
VVERYLLNQEEPFTHEEKEALEKELAQQPPLLQLHIPPDNLGKLPPPKEDPLLKYLGCIGQLLGILLII